ncbi:MAG: ion channel, partial [Ignavibacteria bacterium]|nr:ion channel [Ignavibacteria bacterium]
MRILPDSTTYLLKLRTSRKNLRLLALLVTLMVGLVAVYSVLFRFIMEYEGKEYSWIAAVYWTTTNMSTLGLGDIAFLSDLGRAFTVVVHSSGLIILLILIPFLFVQLFQSSARAPRQLPAGTKGHVILTNYDPLTVALIRRLNSFRLPYALVLEDITQALHLHDQGLRVVVGDLNNPETFVNVCAGKAALIASTSTDEVNTNIAYTVREVSSTVPLISTGHGSVSVEILKGAGSTRVLQLADMMGQALARRILGADAMAHVVGQVDDLLIAEATAAGTPLVGKTLQETKFREMVGTTIVGIWERGEFRAATP